MPSTVTLTVRERAMRAIERRLKGITRDAGYNLTFNHVHRTREMPQRAEDPPELWIINESATMDERGAGEVFEIARMEVWIVVPGTDPEKSDMWLNLAVGDVQKALACGTVIDTLGPIDYEVDVRLGSFQPLYWVDQVVIGRLDATARYWYLIGDPTRWDTADSAVQDTI